MEDWTELQLNEKMHQKEKYFVFFYTPLCGTCQVAKKMMAIVEAIEPAAETGMCNLNFMPKKADYFQIESVPCLVAVEGNKTLKKIYAFHSVEYLLTEIREIVKGE